MNSPLLPAGAQELNRLFRRYREDSDVDALAALMALADRDPGAVCEHLDAELLTRPVSPYLWGMRAVLKDRAGDRLAAMQSWLQLSASIEKQWDSQRLGALGWGSAQAWAAVGERYRNLRSELLREAYEGIRQQHGATALIRVDRALAGYLGEAVVIPKYPTQRPKVFYVPGLTQGGFLDPFEHPVAVALNENAAVIRREYLDVFAEGLGVEPFLRDINEVDSTQYIGGDGERPGWDAFFFYRHGVRFERNHNRCPNTSALLDAQDLCRIDSQAPEVCFSIMRPGTRIQPHHGVTNSRVVIHIPLIVPTGCFLELTGVGRHYWEEGRANVFDDTFEHSAENPTQQPRGILLMDAWHPGLHAHECDAIRKLVEAITRIETPTLNGKLN